MGQRSVAYVAVALLVWLAVVAGSAAAIGTSARSAVVVGKVLLCGHTRNGPLHCMPADHAVVSVRNARDQLVATQRISNAHFSFHLRPGDYQMSARWTGANSATRSVVAKAHRTVRTKLRVALH